MSRSQGAMGRTATAPTLALRIFDDATATDPPPTKLSSPPLSRFFADWVERNFLAARRAKPRNCEQYRESVRLWLQYTADPPLTAIDQGTLTDFSLALQSRTWRGRPICTRTVNKHLKSIQTILRLAGPPSDGNRLGCGLLDRVPYAALLPESRRRPRRGLTLAEVEAIWEAFDGAVEPRIRGMRAGRWSCALLLFLHNTGLRIDAALRATWSMLDDRWLVVPPPLGKTKHESWIWLNEPAMRTIQTIRTRDERIFSWPWTTRHWHTFRRRLLEQRARPDRRHWQTYGLRRTLATYLAKRNPAVAALMLGHSGGSVLLDHYVDPSIVSELMAEYPQPRQAEAWLYGAAAPDRQLTLF